MPPQRIRPINQNDRRILPNLLLVYVTHVTILKNIFFLYLATNEHEFIQITNNNCKEEKGEMGLFWENCNLIRKTLQRVLIIFISALSPQTIFVTIYV